MATLPIRRMILYKHGVGFFERRGAVEGQEVQFTFRRDEVNDALKSVTVVDRAGGQVLGVHYETPEDRQARLDDSSIVLSPDHSLLDLLRALRGREVRLSLTEGERSGRLIGVDVDEQAPLEKSAIVLLEGAAHSAAAFPVAALRAIAVLDERAAHDLRFFLDTAMSEEVRRDVTVRLSPGSHDLSAFYIAPSPTWRVSYRVVAERAAPGAEQGRLLLQGWGLFDNRLDEDLEEVAVTLVAGMPISFVYDLATSRIPERPVVEDEARVAAAPVEFQADLRVGGPAGAPMMAEAAAGPRMRMMAAAPAPQAQMLDLASVAATAPQAQGADLGELFQYVVTAPVSVKRGQSAMVPILGTPLDYRRELLYNGAKMPAHPVVAARFRNETGLTLERGPVTVVEDGEYRGEAIVPFTKDGAEVYLAYAVELGVKVGEREERSVNTAGLHVQGAYLLVEEWNTTATVYTLENSTGSDMVVTVEHAKPEGYELVDTRAADAETAEYRRWRVDCPARTATEFTVRERIRRSRYEQIIDQTYDRLRQYLADKWLDEATYRRLAALLDERTQIAKDQQELQQLEAERAQLYTRQEQLRKNMEVMSKDSAEESQLRRRLRKQLEESEDRLAEIDRRGVDLKSDIRRREQKIQDELAALA